MKQTILKIATFLCDIMGSTSNLQIKNLWHNLNDGSLSQAEVSAVMNELFSEGHFQRKVTMKDGFSFFEYSIEKAVQPLLPAINVQDGDTAPTDPGTDFVQSMSADKVDVVDEITKSLIKALETDPNKDLYAISKSNTGITLGKVGAFATGFLNSLDGGLFLCYTNEIKPVLFNTKDKFEARKIFKDLTSAKHDDVRMITLKGYLKKTNLAA